MRCHLGGALVAAGLEADDAVPALADLLVREVPLVLGGHLGAEGGAGVLGVVLGGATWTRLIGDVFTITEKGRALLPTRSVSQFHVYLA